MKIQKIDKFKYYFILCNKVSKMLNKKIKRKRLADLFSSRVRKKAQMQISFGMIFSIILIIVFLAFAFYGIKTFMGIQNSAVIGKFFGEFQSDIDTAWRSTESSQEKEYFLPSKLNYVCFADFGSSANGDNSGLFSELRANSYGQENIFTYPTGLFKIESKKTENIDLVEITGEENPFCIEVINGKIRVILSKNSGEALVTIKRAE